MVLEREEDDPSVVLVTGGAGYIGSHTLRQLREQGIRSLVFDSLEQGHRGAVLEADLVQGNLADEAGLNRLFEDQPISAVIHFASHCYVGESVENPQRYFEDNVGNALTLLRVMLRHRVDRFIFSSSCATYGDPVKIPMNEEHPQAPVNPYGDTKLIIERILGHYSKAYGLSFVSLRYFNAAGASLDRLIGESHQPETHLIPLILKAALKERDAIQIYGDDYDTEDGTCIRDYIHVIDLADAHCRALQWLQKGGSSECFNLGTGCGYSVRQVLEESCRATGRDIPFQVVERRPGDPPRLVADPSKAEAKLGWKAQHSDLSEIIRTAWAWEQNRRY